MNFSENNNSNTDTTEINTPASNNADPDINASCAHSQDKGQVRSRRQRIKKKPVIEYKWKKV